MVLLKFLVLASLIITAIVLAVGIFSSFKGGAFNEKYGNRLMRLRVAMQGVTLLLFAIFLMMS